MVGYRYCWFVVGLLLLVCCCWSVVVVVVGGGGGGGGVVVVVVVVVANSITTTTNNNNHRHLRTTHYSTHHELSQGLQSKADFGEVVLELLDGDLRPSDSVKRARHDPKLALAHFVLHVVLAEDSNRLPAHGGGGGGDRCK